MSFVPWSMSLIEARWGSSRLQNYDAILRNSVFATGAGQVWRLIISLLIALPLCLSVAYKRYLGGESTIVLHPLVRWNQYGIFPPTNTSATYSENFANPTYLYINATSDFFESSVSNKFPENPFENNSTLAYGHNILLLSDTSAAALDLPRLSYINSIRRRLRRGES